jgi:RNA polymerase sigma-70 factor (ECF subfamily)
VQDPDFLLKAGHVPRNPVLASGTPEEDILKSELINNLARCLKSLPLDQREAVVLRFYQGLSFAEIAAISGRSESAVKMRVYRGLERLKKVMGEIQSRVIKT